MIELHAFRKGQDNAEEWLEKFSRILDDNPWFEKLLSGELVTKATKGTLPDSLVNGDLEVTGNVDVDGNLNVDGTAQIDGRTRIGTTTTGVDLNLGGSPAQVICRCINSYIAQYLNSTYTQQKIMTYPSSTGTYLDLYSSDSAAYVDIYYDGGIGHKNFWRFYSSDTDSPLVYNHHGTNRTNMNPTLTDGATAIAYLFDTVNSLSNAAAKLASWKNAGNEKIYFDVSGRIYIVQSSAPAVTTDKLYNVGGALVWNGITLGAGVTNGDTHDHVGGDGAQIDHGGLGGNADDDHAQYLLLAGRSGQTISDTIGVGSAPDSDAQLTVTSTTKGFLPPRMTTTERDAITTPTEGLMIYDTTTHKMAYYNGTVWVEP